MKTRHIQMVRAVQFSNKPKVTASEAKAIFTDFGNKVTESLGSLCHSFGKSVTNSMDGLLKSLKTLNTSLKKANEIAKDGK